MSTEGVLVVDKPGGMTSHDVVARVRRIAGTRRVGHAGTLDPMATGVLVLGLGRATRLLGHLALTEKSYEATLRLGVVTTTDDAEGEAVSTSDASDVGDEALRAGISALTGSIMQVPSAVSAVKVDGVRSYARARAGETVTLSARPVVVSVFDVLARRGDDIDVRIECSTGTYVRALARDLGAILGVGAHLVALRRTRVGPYLLSAACTLEALGTDLDVQSLAAAVATAFPRRDITTAEAELLAHGGLLAPSDLGSGPVGVFTPDGEVVALVADRDGAARSLAVFTPAS